MEQPIRVGIVGVGWGSLVHAPAFHLVPGFEVAAICGRDPARLAAAAESSGITDTATDWHTFVQRDDLDLISIAVPVDLHGPVFLAALTAGKHVLCEKPLALTAEESRTMTQAAEESDLATAICFQNRWSARRLAAWDIVSSGAFGTPYYAQITNTGPYWHPSHPLQAEWMYSLEAGGGYLNGMAAHEIDYLQTLFGRVIAVCADVRSSLSVRARPDGSSLAVDADDTSALVLRFESGAVATLTTSVVGYGAMSNSFFAFGSGGTIDLSGMGSEGSAVFRRVGADGATTLEAPGKAPGTHGEAIRARPGRRSARAASRLAQLLAEWRPAFSGLPTRAPTIREGWSVQQVIEAARASSAGAGWVEIAAE